MTPASAEIVHIGCHGASSTISADLPISSGKPEASLKILATEVQARADDGKDFECKSPEN